jgi:hypothetical protein
MLNRDSLFQDCFLATYALSIAAAFAAAFGHWLTWPETLALLAIPTVWMSHYSRIRAAGIAAGVAFVAGAWIVVPPTWSFHVGTEGILALFGFAASMWSISATLQRKHQRPGFSESNLGSNGH